MKYLYNNLIVLWSFHQENVHHQDAQMFFNSATRRRSIRRGSQLSLSPSGKNITTTRQQQNGIYVGGGGNEGEFIAPLKKPPLQQAPWSKHLSLHHWQQLTPRTKYLAESAALIDVSNEELEKREKQERKFEKSMVKKQMSMLRRQNTNANFKL